jgi:hypothetical protein
MDLSGFHCFDSRYTSQRPSQAISRPHFSVIPIRTCKYGE